MRCMPVGIEQWREGIGRYNYEFSSKAMINIHILDLIACLCYTIAYLYLLISISVITLPFSILASSFFSLFSLNKFLPFVYFSEIVSLQNPYHHYIKATLCVLVMICFISTWIVEISKTEISFLLCSPAYRTWIIVR